MDASFTKTTRDEAFLKSIGGYHSVIDECQYVLSGSVRFTSQASIRESLTGRIMNVELLPMVLSELRQEPLAQNIQALLRARSCHDLEQTLKLDAKEFASRSKAVELYLERGGLPGICFMRDSKLRTDKIREQLRTIIDRDLRLILPTSLAYPTLFEFIKCLAELEGSPIQFQKIKLRTRLAPKTQHKIINALESVFVLRRLQGFKFKNSLISFGQNIKSSQR